MSAQRTKKYRTLLKALDETSDSNSSQHHSTESSINSGDAHSVDNDVEGNNICSRMSSPYSARNSPRECLSELRDFSSPIASYDSASNSDDLPFDDQKPELNLKEKLRQWAVHNVAHVTNACVTELLLILRQEGHTELPKTAQTLLCTARGGKQYCIKHMSGNKKEYGEYTYLGIQTQLEMAVVPEVYPAETIGVLVNVDGMPLYNRCGVTLWPILIKVCDPKFQADPLMVGAFCGITKPKRADDFLQEFVEEAAMLIQNGLKIKGKLYRFEIIAFVCDTPARSFIKCTKGHTGFYSCERCEIKGDTVEGNRRVFGEMDCRLRTKESFEMKTQPEHHQKNRVSPLLQIPGFDPVKQVTLDYMHLLCSGAMKFILDKCINGGRNNLCSISAPDGIENLQILLDKSVTPNVPKEFQRKKFDLSDLANWKATQYRFILLYAGLLMKNYWPKSVFRHFMLLFVACRMLCDSEGADLKAGRAKIYLRKFFKNLPRYYGEYSQTMNMHNLLHVADDVISLRMPLSMFSSFPFENYLGKLKKLVRTPRAPLAQIVRRLSEVQSTSNHVIREIPILSHCTRREENVGPTINSEIVKEIKVGNIHISTSPPDNIVQIVNDDIVQINNIYVPGNYRKNDGGSAQLDVNFEGYNIEILAENVFEKPCSSSEVGIMKLGSISKSKKTYGAARIKNKCIKLDVNDNAYAITLLHGH